MRSASTIMTSGAPLPAETAVWNLSYASPPAPAFVQQTWTSSLASLKLSTTDSMFGYQAHIVTTGRSSLGIVFSQLLALSPPPPPPLSPSFPLPPPEHETRAPASTSVAAAAMTGVVFTVFPFG